MAATLTRYDVEAQIERYKINGFVVFEEFIPAAKVDRMREAFAPLLEAVVARDSSVEGGKRHEGEGRRQTVNRYTVEVPWQPPFADPTIYEHPDLLAFFDRLWGTADYELVGYSSNNPLPGSEYQRWHRDVPLWSPHIPSPTSPNIGVKFPLVDTFEANGSFEVIPCTQFLADPSLESRYDEIVRAGDFLSRRLNLKKGSLWIQDPRALHRGTPNRSDHARPELVLVYKLAWFHNRRFIEMSRAEHERLSERGRKLLRGCRIAD